MKFDNVKEKITETPSIYNEKRVAWKEKEEEKEETRDARGGTTRKRTMGLKHPRQF